MSNQVISLKYLDISARDATNIMLLSVAEARAVKLRALAKLQITATDDQTPLQAWILAMCKHNGLPEQLPATTIGEAARDLCREWIYFLA